MIFGECSDIFALVPFHGQDDIFQMAVSHRCLVQKLGKAAIFFPKILLAENDDIAPVIILVVEKIIFHSVIAEFKLLLQLSHAPQFTDCHMVILLEFGRCVIRRTNSKNRLNISFFRATIKPYGKFKSYGRVLNQQSRNKK